MWIPDTRGAMLLSQCDASRWRFDMNVSALFRDQLARNFDNQEQQDG